MSTPKFKQLWSVYQPPPKRMEVGSGQVTWMFDPARWRDAEVILVLDNAAGARLAWHPKWEPKQSEVRVERNPWNPTTVGKVYTLKPEDWLWALYHKEDLDEAHKRQTSGTHALYLVRS